MVENAANWRWPGGVNVGDFGAEPKAVAGDEGFGFVLERNVSKIESGVGAQVSQA